MSIPAQNVSWRARGFADGGLSTRRQRKDLRGGRRSSAGPRSYGSAAAAAGCWAKVGVDCRIAVSSAVISAGMSAKSGVVR